MNKWIVALIGAVVIVGGGIAVVVTRSKDSKTGVVNNTTTGQSQEVKTGDAAMIAVDACEVLTQAAADQTVGGGATKSDTTAGNASSDDVSVSNCNYLKKPSTGNPLQDAKNGTTLGILARAAKTSKGAASNKAVFSDQKPAGVQDVSGYGDKAYFNPTYGQLNILKGNNWYILSVKKGIGPGSSVALDHVTPLADAVKANLK